MNAEPANNYDEVDLGQELKSLRNEKESPGKGRGWLWVMATRNATGVCTACWYDLQSRRELTSGSEKQ